MVQIFVWGDFWDEWYFFYAIFGTNGASVPYFRVSSFWLKNALNIEKWRNDCAMGSVAGGAEPSISIHFSVRLKNLTSGASSV